MSDSKPVIFISHVSKEKELASVLKSLIHESFEDTVEVFLSSDAVSIRPGKEWFSQIMEYLRKCDAILLLCSNASFRSPWINFDAGAVAARKDSPNEGPLVISLCHSGLTKGDLHAPLNVYQAVNLMEEPHLKEVFKELAVEVGRGSLSADFGPYLENAKRWEAGYLFWNDCNDAFRFLRKLLGDNYQGFLRGEEIAFNNLPETTHDQLIQHVEFLSSPNIVQLIRCKRTFNVTGWIFEGRLVPSEKLAEIVADPYFECS